ncbi:MAG: RluA family pseudouridine synthase [Candidatus Vogelbacteria bacterium]|nr:RluA family pseudouridine synthase [Candidatus Vogelbacteria bacterium]
MLPIEVVYEDNNVLVINKPAGLLVHQTHESKEATLVDWLLKRYPDIGEVGEEQTLANGVRIKRPGIVHRLDKDTSGVMVIAKNQQAYDFLKSQFQNRKVRKTYRALVYGNVRDSEGVIDTPISKSQKDFRAFTTARGRGEEREAETEYKVLERFRGYTFLEVRPRTGRTHQIRVHLRSVNHAVVCDALYAKGRECPGGIGRQALHAYTLELAMPFDETIVRLEAELPEDFAASLAHLRAL